MQNETSVYRRSHKSYIAILVAGIVLSLLIFLISICYGNYKTSLQEVLLAIKYLEKYAQIYSIIILSRLPRLIASVFVGASLSVAGLIYQELFSNRMVSPDILGVSAGAGVGASISIFLGLSILPTSIFAFMGGIISVAMTMSASRLFGENDKEPVAMVLAGIVVGGLMNSIMGLFKYLANDAQLSTITFWLLGGFYTTKYEHLKVVCPIISVGLLVLSFLRWKIVMLRNGDADAITHGINAKLVRIICIVITTIITAVSICISGTIGWIRLAIPNLMRLLVRNDGKKLLPLSLVYGAFFTELCDLLARSITNTEIPVGILTGILGAIMFIGSCSTGKKGKITLIEFIHYSFSYGEKKFLMI